MSVRVDHDHGAKKLAITPLFRLRNWIQTKRKKKIYRYIVRSKSCILICKFLLRVNWGCHPIDIEQNKSTWDTFLALHYFKKKTASLRIFVEWRELFHTPPYQLYDCRILVASSWDCKRMQFAPPTKSDLCLKLTLFFNRVNKHNSQQSKRNFLPLVTTRKFFCLLALISPIPPNRKPVQVSLTKKSEPKSFWR